MISVSITTRGKLTGRSISIATHGKFCVAIDDTRKKFNLINFGRYIANAIRDDSPILALSQSLFGTAHTVYYHALDSEAPLPSEYPAFIIRPLSKGRSENAFKRSFQYTVALCLEDDTSTTATDGNGVKTVVQQGTESIEDMLDLAMTAIAGITPDLLYDDKETSLNTVEYYPLYYGELNLTATFPVTIGGREPTLI